MRRMTALGLGTIIFVLVANALLRGPAIDEFATLQLSDLGKGFSAIGDGWLHDTHPPLFALWSTLLSLIGVTSIPAARLLSNVPPVVMIIYTARRFTRREPDELTFHAALLLLVLSAPATVDAFASYRSGFWEIAALTVLVQVARHVAIANADLRGRRDQGLAPLAVTAAACAIMIHYVGGIFGVTLTAAIILGALAKGLKRWARLLIWAIVAAGLSTLLFAWLQSEHWISGLDKNWPAGVPGSAIVLGLGIGALIHNPVPLAGLFYVRHDWSRKESGFVVLILGALVAALLLLIEIDSQKPLLSANNLGGISVLVCALMAALADKFAVERRLHGLLVLVSVLVVLVPFVLHGPDRRWQANAKRISQIAVTCPATRIYAASPWLLHDGAGVKARRDDSTFARGYNHVGESRGFVPQVIGRTGTTRIAMGDCPTLLWIEQMPVDAGFKPESALAAARLKGLDGAHLTLIRSKSGFVVRVDRP
ncbi:MAG: hypothetical protein JWR77_1145 [Rhizorhabdus sp.]|nr:hypothetical protein [Rhizorhabdus sp.]